MTTVAMHAAPGPGRNELNIAAPVFRNHFQGCQLALDPVRIGTFLVHLVDADHARFAGCFEELPHEFGADLDARRSGYEHDNQRSQTYRQTREGRLPLWSGKLPAQRRTPGLSILSLLALPESVRQRPWLIHVCKTGSVQLAQRGQSGDTL